MYEDFATSKSPRLQHTLAHTCSDVGDESMMLWDAEILSGSTKTLQLCTSVHVSGKRNTSELVDSDYVQESSHATTTSLEREIHKEKIITDDDDDDDNDNYDNEQTTVKTNAA
jgi:hypothetical protein